MNFRSDNSWEPEENLDCPHLIAAFETARNARELKEMKKRNKNKKIEEIKKPRGFERGFQLQKIVGATEAKNDLCFLVKWQDCDEYDLMPAYELNSKAPDFMISYYENKSVLHRKAASRNNTMSFLDLVNETITDNDITNNASNATIDDEMNGTNESANNSEMISDDVTSISEDQSMTSGSVIIEPNKTVVVAHDAGADLNFDPDNIIVEEHDY